MLAYIPAPWILWDMDHDLKMVIFRWSGPTSLHRRLVLRQAGPGLAEALRRHRPGLGATGPAVGPTRRGPGGPWGRKMGKTYEHLATTENHGKPYGLMVDEFIFLGIQKHLLGFSAWDMKLQESNKMD